MMDSLDKAPLPVGNRQLTRSLAMLAVLATMYNQLRWKGLADASNDPATPFAWAKSVSEQIPRSVLLTRVGNGHTSYGFSDCISAAEDAYLTNLVLPPQETTCTS